MSGIELKKNDNQKRKQNIKLIVCLVSSNLLLFLLFSFLGKTQEVPPPVPTNKRAFHSQHQKLALQLELNVVYSADEAEIPIALYTENKKLLVSRAYLHPEKISQKEDLANTSDMNPKEEKEKFIVEIPDEKLESLIAYQGEKLLAYPAHHLIQKQSPKHLPGETYEISF